MRKTLYTLLTVAAMLCMLTACDPSVFYSNNHRVNEEGWNMNDKLCYDIDVTDTARLYTFYVDLRVSADYPYSNAFFFINATFPDGGIATDTLECPLADVDGRWYGRRSGQYIDNRYAFRKNIIFPSKGHYHFDIVHAMRDTNVVGIKSIGLRIEYAK